MSSLFKHFSMYVSNGCATDDTWRVWWKTMHLTLQHYPRKRLEFVDPLAVALCHLSNKIRAIQSIHQKKIPTFPFHKAKFLIQCWFFFSTLLELSNQWQFADKHFSQRTGRAFKASRKNQGQDAETVSDRLFQSCCTFQMVPGEMAF